jgi:gliding motility-associated-like protein
MTFKFMRKLFTVVILNMLVLCVSGQSSFSAGIVTSTTLFCTDAPVTYSLSTSEPSELTYTWTVLPLKGLLSSTDPNYPEVTLRFSGIVTYTVSCFFTDATGNRSVVHTTLMPARAAQASFNASLSTTGFPTDLILTNYSSNSLSHYWKFSDAFTDSSLHSSRHYTSGGSYSVTLYTFGIKGCNDSASYRFRISDSSGVTLPNIFTPNGDGVNDVFQPEVRGISALQAWVYNRYGTLVAFWDKPKSGWDGHTTSGEECSEGVYIIVLEATGFDGKHYKLKGNVTLIR